MGRITESEWQEKHGLTDEEFKLVKYVRILFNGTVKVFERNL